MLQNQTARAAVVIAALAATLTAFLVVKLFTDDDLASMLTFVLFLMTVVISLISVFGDHPQRKQGGGGA